MTTETSKPAATEFNPVALMNSILSQAAAWRTPATGLLQVQQHWLSFLSDRLKQDATLMEQLAACSTPVEANKVVADFCTAAVGAYQHELAEAARLTTAALTTPAPVNASESAKKDAN